MERAWSEHGASMERAWSEHGANTERARSEHGASTKRAWSEHGASKERARSDAGSAASVSLKQRAVDRFGGGGSGANRRDKQLAQFLIKINYFSMMPVEV